jgi:hypothetical protein
VSQRPCNRHRRVKLLAWLFGYWRVARCSEHAAICMAYPVGENEKPMKLRKTLKKLFGSKVYEHRIVLTYATGREYTIYEGTDAQKAERMFEKSCGQMKMLASIYCVEWFRDGNKFKFV